MVRLFLAQVSIELFVLQFSQGYPVTDGDRKMINHRCGAHIHMSNSRFNS